MASNPAPPSTLTSEPSDIPNTIIPPGRAPLKVTTSSSPTYIHSCARSNQFASRNDPMTLLFQAEKLPPLPNEASIGPDIRLSKFGCDILRTRLSKLSNEAIERMIYDSGISRMTAKCQSSGAFVVEAAGFAAVTCWEPQYAPEPPENWEEKYGPGKPDADLSGVIDGLVSNGVPMARIIEDRPVFGEFWMQMEKAKYKFLYPVIWRAAQERTKQAAIAASSPSETNGLVPDTHVDKEALKYWYICLTSRNPGVQPPVPGAVRAVIQPIVKRFIEKEGIPAVWIVASNPRAMDVYGWFGFRMVQEIVIGRDEKGKDIVSWCMLYTGERKGKK